MQTLSYTAVRADLAKTMEHVCEDHAPIIVTRANAKSVVMLSLTDFEAWQETVYLLKSPKNAARLTESIAEIEGLIAKQKKSRKKSR